MEGRIRHIQACSSGPRSSRTTAAAARSGPGSVVEIRYEGDDESERYLLGSIEERHDELEVISPGSPLGAALLGAKPGDTVSFEAPNGNTLRVEIRAVE